MKLIEINWGPSKRQLRQFGVISFFLSPLFGWMWNISSSGLAIMTCIGALIAVLSFAWPPAIKPIFIGLMLVAAPIGMVVGELAMLLIFLGIFLPISLVFRLMGRDALRLKIDKNAASYWQPKSEPKQVSSYYRRY